MSEEQKHLADWQREAVQAAQAGQNSAISGQNVPPQAPIQPAEVFPQTNPQPFVAPNAGIPGPYPPQPTVSTFVQPEEQLPETSQVAQSKQKKHFLKKLLITFIVIIIVVVVISIIAALLKPRRPASNNTAAQTVSHGRDIPTNCYQFKVPFTYQLDLSTTNCTLSGGDGVQHELVGVQPVKTDKTDDAQLKNLAQYTIGSFAKSYPKLKQTQQSSGQFAGKSALITAAADDTQQLTTYFIVPDKPYTINNESYPLVLVTYLAPANQTEGLKNLEDSWQWH